jgi:hypothetical protein
MSTPLLEESGYVGSGLCLGAPALWSGLGAISLDTGWPATLQWSECVESPDWSQMLSAKLHQNPCGASQTAGAWGPTAHLLDQLPLGLVLSNCAFLSPFWTLGPWGPR